MRSLQLIFVCMFAYGLYTQYLGAALLSLMIAAFIEFAVYTYKKQDRRRVKKCISTVPTVDKLCEYECESVRDCL